jgi:hypothetical protein
MPLGAKMHCGCLGGSFSVRFVLVSVGSAFECLSYHGKKTSCWPTAGSPFLNRYSLSH